MKREIQHLSDGRLMEYSSNGVNSSSAVILHSGTTQDISGWQSWFDKFAAVGIKAIAFNRSGYSSSTPMPGRVTIDVANDVSELLSSLGISRFVSAGLSGGGQHALATGLGTGCVGVVSVGGLAPFAELGERFYEGMQQVDIDEYHDALRNIDDLVKRFQGWIDSGVEENAAGTEASLNDKRAMSSHTWPILMSSMTYTMNNGWDWVADDYSSYLQPWGFDPRSLRVPAIIWQGGLDRNVPPIHGRWHQENIPGAVLRLIDDESHIGLFVNYEDQIIGDVATLLGRNL